MPISDHPTIDSLASWLGAASPSHALILEDNSAGSVSPLARWIEGVRATGSHEVISASLGPCGGLVLERDILARLFCELYPDDSEEPPTFSLAELRDHVRAGLPARESQRTRLIILDRVNWGEQSFRQDLRYLLGDLRREQKIAVSLGADDECEASIAEWCERLGWRAEETLCLRLPASLEGELPPKERAREWVSACLALDEGRGNTTAVLDVLAAALRPMRSEEVAVILDLDPSLVETSLGLAPEGAVAIDPRGRYAFNDETVARAWGALRSEASARVRERTLALGEAVLRGEAKRVPPYVIEHHGSLLGGHGGARAQVSLVSEAWANAWAPLSNPLGFEADVARVWFAAERDLVASASGPAPDRAAPVFTIFRCVQVSHSVMSRVPRLPDPPGAMRHELKSGNTVGERAAALAGLAEALTPSQRTRVRECAVDALLEEETTITEANLLVRLGRWFEGERRDAIVKRVLHTYRADAVDSPNSVWLLRAAPLLSAEERRALCEEVVGQMRKLPDYDVKAVRDALGAAPADVAPQLTPAIHVLPRPDRFRLGCALAPFLDADVGRRVVEEILDGADEDPYSLGFGDVRSLAPALDAAQLSRLGRALRRQAYGDQLVGICLRALCALGQASEAESLAEDDLGSMPFDWALALAVGSRDRRSELREELARRLATMAEVRVGWTLDRDAAELVGILGTDEIVRVARTLAVDEDRIVARVALVPFAMETEKRALVTEAVQTVRASTAGGDLHERALLSCWEWMSIPDACYLLARVSCDMDALWALKDLAPLLKHLAGDDAPSKIAEQLVDVGRWAP